MNRVFDSSGPEGKVRGTPQQIIDKYAQLARDAQLSNDRVAMENFQQHGEHYTRMLGEAQREADARREQQEAQNRERQREREEAREQAAAAAEAQPQPQPNAPKSADPVFVGDAPQPDVAPAPVAETSGEALDVVDAVQGRADTGLVETPEEAPAKSRSRRTRKPKPKAKPEAAEADAAPEALDLAPEAEAKPAAKKPAAPKPAAKKPKAAPAPEPEAPSEPSAEKDGGDEPKEAAE